MNWFLRDLKSGRIVMLENGDILGRSQGNHHFPEILKMSRSHCQFVIEEGRIFLLDLKSTNGTYVNNEKIAPNLKSELKVGSEIRFGDNTFLLERRESSVVSPPIQKVPITKVQTNIVAISENPFNFTANKKELFFLLIKNSIFTILTFGLYFSYAKTNMRKYLWRSTSLNKSSFVFNGNPRHLMKANLILMGIFILSSVVIQFSATFLTKIHPMLSVMPFLLYLVLISFLVIKAKYNGFAYLCNNTTYRSIRFYVNRQGSSEYMKKSIVGSILTVLTLGLYYPFMKYDLEQIKWDNCYFGKSKFNYDPDKKKEYVILCYKNILLTILSFGLYGYWAMASLHRFKMGLIKIEGAKLDSKANGMGLFVTQIKCMLLVVFTLGLGAPFVPMMILTYYLNNLSLVGAIDFDGIIQTAKNNKDGAMGDAVLDFFDADVMDIA